MNINPTFRFALLGTTLLTLAACGDDPADSADSNAEKVISAVASKPADENLLKFIPADSPYVLANIERFPEKDMTDLISKFSDFYAAVPDLIETIITTEGDDLTEQQAEFFRFLGDELFTDFSPEKMANLGFRMDGYVALYGLDVLPMMQLELSDEAKFNAFVARLEEKAGETIPVAEHDGKSYWRYSDDEDNPDTVMLAVAVHEKRLTAALIPVQMTDQYMPYLFGKLPEKSMADSGALDKIASRHGFNGYGIGLIDSRNIMDAAYFGEDKTFPGNLLEAMGEDTPEVTDACRVEFNELIEKFPRAVFGYTAFSSNKVSFKSVVEVEPGLAGELKGLQTEVPGIGAPGGLFSLGFGIDAVALQTFAKSVVDNIAAKPYQCEELADLNELTENSEALAAPLPPFASDIKGFNLVVHDMEMPDGAMVPAVKAQAVLRVDNPMNLYSMASMMQPGVAELELKADGVPVAVPPSIIPPFVDSPYIAMTDKGIGFSVGAGMEANLVAFMSLPPSPDNPVMAYSYDLNKIWEVLQPLMGMATASVEEDDMAAVEGQIDLASKMFKMMGPIAFRMNLSDNGVETLDTLEIK